MEVILPVLLIIVGLALLAVEFYLTPGFNVAGIVGIFLLLVAVGLAFYKGGLEGGILALVAAVVLSLLLAWVSYRTGVWKRLVLQTRLRGGSGRVEVQHARFLGKSGVAVTPLRPTGVAEIDGQRVEVTTEGEYIAVGSPVKVVAINSRQVFVRLDLESDKQ